jgi:hypothetical protein
MILQIIQQRQGITFLEIADCEGIRLVYNKKQLSEELARLQAQRKIYLVKPNRGKRAFFPWLDSFKCDICEGTLPKSRPSLDNPDLCVKCVKMSKAIAKLEDINWMMREWSIRPIVETLTPDPRGYYGVSR